jgi:hypothetical protein
VFPDTEQVLYQETTRDVMRIRVWVGTSRAGKGLFAAQHIKKGTRIIQDIGQKISKEEIAERLYQGNQYIFEGNDRYHIDGKTLQNKALCTNHSYASTVTSRRAWRDEARRISRIGTESNRDAGGKNSHDPP